MSVSRKRQALAGAITLIGIMSLTWQGMAQQLFIYPTKGQNAQQQSRDRYECHAWAVQQTGYDPSNAQSQPQRQAMAPPPQRARKSVV